MGLSPRDLEILLDQQSHTANTDGCSRLIQTSVEVLQRLLAKPSTRVVIFRETLELCQRIQNMLQEKTPVSDVYQEFLKLSKVWLPFQRILWSLPKVTMRDIMQAPEAERQALLKKQDACDREYSLLHRASGLPNYYGSGWADVLTLNAIMAQVMSSSLPDQARIENIRHYIKKIVDIISKSLNKEFTEIDCSDKYLRECSNYLSQFFDYQKRRYVISKDFANTIRTPKELMDILLMMIPLHMKADSHQLVNVVLNLTSDWYIEIPIPITTDFPITYPKDLTNHSYTWRLDASYFLQWIVDIFGESVRFRVENWAFVFWIRAYPETRVSM